MPKRDLTRLVGQVTRAVIDAGTQARLSSTEMRVLMGVIYFTVSYGRSNDRVTTSRLATQAGVNPDGSERTRMRETGRALRALREKQLVVYEPSQRHGLASLIGIPPALIETVSHQTLKDVSPHTERVSQEPPHGVRARSNEVSPQTAFQRRASDSSSKGTAAARSSGSAAVPDACRACGAADDLELLRSGGVLCHCGVVTKGAA